MPPRALTRESERRFGMLGRMVAGLLGVALLGAAMAAVVFDGWWGVLEGLPALALGASAIFTSVVGHEPRWWRSY